MIRRRPYMPADKSLDVLRAFGAWVRQSDLVDAIADDLIGYSRDEIDGALATACKYLFIQTLDIPHTEARRRRNVS